MQLRWLSRDFEELGREHGQIRGPAFQPLSCAAGQQQMDSPNGHKVLPRGITQNEGRDSAVGQTGEA